MNDDQKRALEVFARACDAGADEHAPHGCGMTPFLRAVGDAVRRATSTSVGPAQVATESYRNNWETLFGKRQAVGQA